MDFDYDDYFDESTTASVYETLIYDCLCGSRSASKCPEELAIQIHNVSQTLILLKFTNSGILIFLNTQQVTRIMRTDIVIDDELMNEAISYEPSVNW